MRVKVNKIEYLFIKNFQDQNKGKYVCPNEMNQFSLDLKYGSSNDKSVLFRASEGDSLLFFCKDLISLSIEATWHWRPHNSNQSFNLRLNPAHFGKRLHFRNNDNDFSLTIANIDWGDSGQYECQRFHKRTYFELVVVRVCADPQQITEGEDVKLECEVSYKFPLIRLHWINMDTKENFLNPHQLRNVTTGQRNWMCAVFDGSKLKALIPLSLNVSQHFTTTARSSTPTTHYHTSDESKTLLQTTRNNRWTTLEADSEGTSHPRKNLIVIISGFSFILVVALGAVCWRRRTKKNSEVEHPTLCVRDSVTYAEVSFRQKSERRKKMEEEVLTCERDSVTYAEVSFRQKSDDVSSECERVSNDDPAETEVLYSSVNLSESLK
ncbi:uncharacterized protein LOC118820386 [Colossoma macropomum]|uniref:uncharacterized protein LOC118820386 n=1 Tax=Colossoma macropomum TaxID=42526 RepID=UPI001863D578|nr:uncharacterized protein LOC118820386 [Colossoma macropomum]